MTSIRVGLIGLGLVGGSLAKALRLFEPGCVIAAFDRDRGTLIRAQQDGVIDTACSAIDCTFSGCDYIFLCTPVESSISYLPILSQYIGPETILTDVGSVKSAIHKAVVKNGLSKNFIGGHPMAGSEKTGFSNAKAALFENAYYILTPENDVPHAMVSRYTQLIEQIHAIPLILDCERHDEITATISHLPHIIASGLVNFVSDRDGSDALLRRLAAGGFRDITRIASSSPDMWEQICLTNREAILAVLHDYTDILTDMERLIAAGDGDALRRRFSEARDYRDSLPDRASGPIEKTFVIYCDLVDEAGGIATIATILAVQNISIKNIGIIHNREFEEGVLRIEFYDSDSGDRAADALTKHRYTIYTR